MSQTDEQLKAIRERIDALDEQLQSLINERASLAQEVAEVKLAAGEEAVFYRPEREAQILRRVKERNQGPLAAEEVARLFREVEAGSADYAVVPVENSTEGAVNYTLDLLLKTPLKICGEVELRIHDHLMTQSGELALVNKVYSHAQSLAQCREWLDAHLPAVERVAVSSNAEAARLAASEEGAAAVAGKSAAELYDLPILAANIEDEPNNTTRFLILGREAVPPSGEDKTALLLSTRNKPGALFQLLEPLARNSISMTRIESRPSRQGTWDYVFFIEVLGHYREPMVAEALTALEKEAALFKILGSFPRAVL